MIPDAVLRTGARCRGVSMAAHSLPSLAVAFIILWTAVPLFRRAGRILLQTTPTAVTETINKSLREVGLLLLGELSRMVSLSRYPRLMACWNAGAITGGPWNRV